jgi:hypothetical protein
LPHLSRGGEPNGSISKIAKPLLKTNMV